MDKELKIKTEEKLKDQAEAAKPWKRHKKKLFVLPLILIAMGLAYYFLSRKIATQIPEIKNITLQDQSDEKIEIDSKQVEVDLFQSVEKQEHLYKIPEKHYQLTPSKNIRYVRLAFILIAKKEKDLDNLEKNDALVMEILNNTLRRSRPEDFEGVKGKEAMRLRLLNAINEQIQPPLIGLHFATIVLR